MGVLQPGPSSSLWPLSGAPGVDRWDAPDPLGLRLWRKGGASKYALALELLSYARNRLRCRPEYVLFDA